MYPSGHIVGFHQAGDGDGVTPQVVNEIATAADDTGHDRARGDS